MARQEGPGIDLSRLGKELSSSSKGINKNTKEIERNATAMDRWKNAMGKVSTRMQLLTKHTRNGASSFSVLRSNLLLTAFAMNSFRRVVLDQIKTWGEHEEALGRVERVLRSTDNAVFQSVEGIQQLATELQNATGVSDTYVVSTAGLLASFKNISGEVFQDAIGTLLDTTAAMNGGVVTAGSLRAEAIRLGKALNDPIQGLTALKRVGVDFSHEQKNQINLFMLQGKAAEAQKMILKELNDEFGNQAKVEGYNLELRRFNSAIGDLQKRIGKDLAPSFTELTKSLTNFINKIDGSDLVNTVKLLAIGYASFTIIGRVGKGIQLATVSLKGLAKSISNTHIVSKGLVRTFQFLKGFLGKTGLFAIGTGVVSKFGISTSNAVSKVKQLGVNSKLTREEILKLNLEEIELLITRKKLQMVTESNIGDLAKSILSNKQYAIEQKKVNDKLQDEIDLLEERQKQLTTRQVTAAQAKLTEGFKAEVQAMGEVDFLTKKLTETAKKLKVPFEDIQGVTGGELFNKLVGDLGVLDTELATSIIEWTRATAEIMEHNLQLEKTQNFYANITQGIGILTEAQSIASSHRLEMMQIEHDQFVSNAESEADIEKEKIRNANISEKARARLTKAIDKDLARTKAQSHNKLVDAQMKSATGSGLMSALGIVGETMQGVSALKVKHSIAKANAKMALGNPLTAPAAAIYEGIAASILGQIGMTKGFGAAQVALAYAQANNQRKSLSATKIKAAQGTDFITSGPTNLLVGDNPGARERVQVTPLSSPNLFGPASGSGGFNVTINNPILTQDYVENELADAIKDAVRRGSDFGLV